MRRLFLFRPEPGASRSAERAREMGLDPVVAPLFEIEPVAWAPPEPARFDAILLTSANAVRCAGEGLRGLRGLPVHAVGERTASAAREAGFDIATIGEAGVERLLGSIKPDVRLLHLCGEDRRDVQAPRQPITEIVVYRARALPAPSALTDFEGQTGALHSPRAAARLAELVGESARSGIRLATISRTAADAAGTGWERLETAEAPDDAALLACAAGLCDKP